jgi:hypothetical protein
LPEQFGGRPEHIEVHHANQNEKSVKDNNAKADPELGIVKNISSVVHHCLIESIHAEGDQDSRIQYPESEIGCEDILDDECDEYPGGKACNKEGNEHGPVTIEESPVMEQPGEQNIIKNGKSIDHYSKMPGLCRQKEKSCSDLDDQYKEDAIKKGIVRLVDFTESYYPDQYSKHNTQAQYKTYCIVHQLRWRGL